MPESVLRNETAHSLLAARLGFGLMQVPRCRYAEDAAAGSVIARASEPGKPEYGKGQLLSRSARLAPIGVPALS
jgi:hypothetical protein